MQVAFSRPYLPGGEAEALAEVIASRWVAQGPRVRVSSPDPVRAHRVLATVTLGAIGAVLCAVAVLAPVPAGDVGDPASVVYSQD